MAQHQLVSTATMHMVAQSAIAYTIIVVTTSKCPKRKKKDLHLLWHHDHQHPSASSNQAWDSANGTIGICPSPFPTSHKPCLPNNFVMYTDRDSAPERRHHINYHFIISSHIC